MQISKIIYVKCKRIEALLLSLLLTCFIISCDSGEGALNLNGQDDHIELLTNQINDVIIPSINTYNNNTKALFESSTLFCESKNEKNLNILIEAYKNSYKSFQSAALHNYYANINYDLVNTTNLFPIDTLLLAEIITSKTYNFSSESQKRANGFPALDYLFYSSMNPLDSFILDENRCDYVLELSESMANKANQLYSMWTGSLKENFIGNDGIEIGSSVHVQLNNVLSYYEDHIRENKVGLPIGRIGPLDSPIESDPTKIEAYYHSQYDGNDLFALSLVRESIQEMEDLYLGGNTSRNDLINSGYDRLLISRGHTEVDSDIKTQFDLIYAKIDERTSITGNTDLYDAIQGLITIFKSDLFPLLNIQDADGKNDGD
jgi:predicted lipoprotein